MGEIIQNAPSSIRPQLESQFGNHLISTTASYNNKLITQNKDDAKESSEVWRQQAEEQMMNLVKDGTPESLEAAKMIQSQIDENIQSNQQIGMISKKQAYIASTENKLNFQSALSIEKYREAVTAGKGDEYLSSIAFDKMPGLSWSESETVRNNTMKWAQAALSADSRYQSLLGAQAQNDIINGAFSPKMSYYEENMTPTNFLNTMTSWTSQQRKAGGEEAQVSQIIQNPNSPDSYESAKPKAINSAYHSIAEGIYKNNQEAVGAGKAAPISMDDAEVIAQRQMAVAAPAFTDAINRMSSGANPESLERSYQMYNRLKDQGSKVLGVKDQNIANMKLYKELLGVYPDDPQKAAEMAYNSSFNTTEEQASLRLKQTNDYFNRNAYTSDALVSWATKIGGFKGQNFQDQNAYVSKTTQMFKDFMKASGNVNVAEEMTKEAISRTWGETQINGIDEVAFLPIEQNMELTNSAPIIQQNIVDQLGPQFMDSKKNFDENPGQLSYWRFKEGRVSFDEYISAKSKIRERQSLSGFVKGLAKGKSPRNELSKEFDIVDKFESGQPVVVEEVHRGGHVIENQLRFATSEVSTQNPNTGQIDGGMNVQIIDPKTLIPRSLPGYFGSMRSTPFVKPDKQYVQSRYMSMFHPGESLLNTSEIIEKHKARKKEQDEIAKLLVSSAQGNRWVIP